VQFLKIYRQIKIVISYIFPWLAASQTKYPLFKVDVSKFDADKLYNMLAPIGYQYNYWSFQCRGQLGNWRKLYWDPEYKKYTWQIHLRLFKDGMLCGHWEPNYEFDLKGHYDETKCLHVPKGEVKLVEILIKQKEVGNE